MDNLSLALSKAIEMAAKYHAGQTDKQGKAYILHCIRVMLKVSYTYDVECMIVAVLHDILEDTDIEEILILDTFGQDVYYAIKALTKQENEPYFIYIKRVKQNKIAKKVKLADLEDNIMRIPELACIDKDKAESLYKRYEKAIYILEY